MTRMYLSPTASILVKIGLFFVECIIGLYNLITFPIRKITLKAYGYILLIAGAFYTAAFHSDLKVYFVLFLVVLGAFAASILIFKLIYNILRKKVSPRVAYLMNSPLGIPLNRFHRIDSRA